MQDQFCPLFVLANAVSGGCGTGKCTGENCAWWNITEDSCAIVQLSRDMNFYVETKDC